VRGKNDYGLGKTVKPPEIMPSAIIKKKRGEKRGKGQTVYSSRNGSLYLKGEGGKGRKVKLEFA